jgi:hypothetical protein
MYLKLVFVLSAFLVRKFAVLNSCISALHHAVKHGKQAISYLNLYFNLKFVSNISHPVSSSILLRRMILAYYSTRLWRILAKRMMLRKATRRRKKKRIRKSTFHELLNSQGGVLGRKLPPGHRIPPRSQRLLKAEFHVASIPSTPSASASICWQPPAEIPSMSSREPHKFRLLVEILINVHPIKFCALSRQVPEDSIHQEKVAEANYSVFYFIPCHHCSKHIDYPCEHFRRSSSTISNPLLASSCLFCWKENSIGSYPHQERAQRGKHVWKLPGCRQWRQGERGCGGYFK